MLVRILSGLLALVVVVPGWAAEAEENVEKEDEAAVEYVLKERRAEVRRAGLKTVREHNIIKILKRSAIEYAGDISYEYNSYYSKARLIRASTRTPDGRRLVVSPDAVHDTMPKHFQEFKMYSDVRTLSFSMPAVQVGSILEYEIELTETKPVMDGQVWDSFYFDEFEPVKEARYTMECPSRTVLKFHCLNFTDAPTSSAKSQNTTLEWTLRDMPRLKHEAGMPPFHNVRRSVHISSVPSWEAVRDWFDALAAEKGKPSDEVRKLVADLTADKQTLEEKVRALHFAVQRDVRYVGVELGKSAYEPHSAADCFRNRYGDCKDQSILLVSMLRQAGIEAYPALVRPNLFGRLVMETPHPGQFNHVVVHVPEGKMWLDPTVKYYDEKNFPAALDNVDALVVGRKDAGFVHIAPLPSDRDVERTIHEVSLRHDGRSTIKETSEFVGRAAAEAREDFENVDREKRRKDLEGAMERRMGHERLLEFGNSEPFDLSTPFQTWMTYESDRFLEKSRLGYSLSLSAQATEYPLSLGSGENRLSPRKPEVRNHDWQALSGCEREIVCRVSLPPGFSPAELPKSQEFKLPHGSVLLTATQRPGMVETTCRVSREPCLIPAARWQQAKNETDRAFSLSSITLNLEDEVEKLLSKGKPHGAAELIEAWTRQSPADSWLYHRLGGLDHKRGLQVRARKAYLKAMELGNHDLSVYTGLAATYGETGETTGGNSNRAQAVAILREAAAHSANKREAQYGLGEILERNDKGIRYGDGAALADAIALYAEMSKEDAKDTRPLVALAECYFAANDYEKSDACFSRAFEMDKFSPEANAGRWVCAAFLGRVTESIDAIRGYYDDNAMLVRELQRVAGKLMSKRRYAEAATMMNQALSLSKSPTRYDLSKMLLRLALKKHADYKTHIELSSPQSAVLSCVAAICYEDADRVRKCFSSRAGLSEGNIRDLTTGVRGMIGDSMQPLRDYVLDVVASEWTMAERKLDDKHVEIKMTPPKDLGPASALGTPKVTSILRKEGNEWRVCAIGPDIYYRAPLAMVASSCIEENDLAGARFYADQIAEHLAVAPKAQTEFSPLHEIEREDFTNSNSRVLAYTGAALLEGDEYVKAVRYLDRADRAEPDNIVLKRILGQALFASERYEEAEKVLAEVVAKKPGDWRSLQRQIEALARMQRYDEAIGKLGRLLEITPSAQKAGFIQANVYEEAGRYDDAMRAFQQCKGHLQTAVATGAEASLLGHLGRKDELVRLLSEERPESHILDVLRRSFSIAFLYMNEIDPAMEQLECILLDDPANEETMLRLAMLLILKGDREEALSLVERAEASPLLSADDRMDLADALLALGRYDKAAKVYGETSGALKMTRDVYRELLLGCCHFLRRDRDAAQQAFKRAAQRQSGKSWPWPVVQYLTGAMPREEMIKIAQNTSNPERRGQFLCEAYYYSAVSSLAEGGRQKAMALFSKALETKSALTAEYVLAKAELDRLRSGGKPVPAVPDLDK